MTLKFEALLHRLTAKKNYDPKTRRSAREKKTMTQKSAQGSAKKNHDPKWGLAGSEKKIMPFGPGCEKLGSPGGEVAAK